MAETAYALCALTSLSCAIMLVRGFVRRRSRFLLWCAACFACLTANNVLLFVDKVIYPNDVLVFLGISFLLWRSLAALAGMCLLVFGLIWDAE